MDGGMEKGEMEMNPPPPQGGPGGPEGGAAAFGGSSVHDFLNVYLWQYIHVFIMGGLLLHFVILPKLRRSWNNQMDKIPVGGHHKSDDAIPREERIRMARERQADKMREVSAADAAVREAKAAKHLEEEQRKQDERMSRTDQFKKGSGRSTGTRKDDRDESDSNHSEYMPVGGQHKSDDAISRKERIRMARERQAEKIHEVSVADAAMREAKVAKDQEDREAKAAKHLEDEKRKQDERMSRTDQFKTGSGRSTGTKKDDDRDESDANPKRLPKLPGSGQQAYEPFPTGRDGEGGGGGSRYRPTGFSRNCGPKG